MKHLVISAKDRKHFLELVNSQPEHYYDGDNRNGITRHMSTHNTRQQIRVIEALEQAKHPKTKPSQWEVILSKADLLYLYSVVLFSFRRPHASHWYGWSEPYHEVHTEDASFRRIRKRFEDAGIHEKPSLRWGWDK